MPIQDDVAIILPEIWLRKISQAVTFAKSKPSWKTLRDLSQ